MLHPTFGSLAILAAVWTFVETLNAREANRKRIEQGAYLTAILMVVTWVAAGYWYVVYYATDKAIILNGAWPFAHNLFMESKEHAFFITLVLSLLLPIIVKFENVAANHKARTLVLFVTALIALSSFAIEGAGALISMAVRVGLQGGA